MDDPVAVQAVKPEMKASITGVKPVVVNLGENPANPPAIENTCCGHKLETPDTVGPFLKFWRLEREAEAKPAPGPVLRSGLGRYQSFGGHHLPNIGGPRTWVGSVLVVTKAALTDVVVELLDASQGGSVLEATELATYSPWRCIRFMLRVPVQLESIRVPYRVTVGGKQIKEGVDYSFHIAGSDEPTHWGYYSCSGFSLDVPAEKREKYWGGMKPMWQDVVQAHEKKPLHLLVGGGDQLYNDDVWSLPSLKKDFLSMKCKTDEEKLARKKAAFTAAMKEEVYWYYFHHYCIHFSQEPIGHVYANVPQVMCWDDHDIFDGWGSYPAYLQASNVFQAVFKAANHFYCIFQQHCTNAENKPLSVYELGARTAIVMPDQRTRRLAEQIVPLEHYMDISMLCRDLPLGIEHVVFVFTVPVVYPHIKGASKALKVASNEWILCGLQAIGVNPMSHFGEPELLDDIDDHWTSPKHADERRFMVKSLQMLSKYRGVRVSLLSGDVHVGGAGRLRSHPEPREEQYKNDWRYMPQIISSAIANPPPPSGMIKVLDFFGWASRGKMFRHTRMEMTPFIKGRAGLLKSLENKRNWCEVTEEPINPDESGGGLVFSLRIEEDVGEDFNVTAHDIVVPPLVPLDARRAEPYFDVASVRLRNRGPFHRCFGSGQETNELNEYDDEDNNFVTGPTQANMGQRPAVV